MKISPRVIMLEFNELCPSVMDRFIRAGYLPNFKRLYEESEIFPTDAEEEGEKLNPWVQWVTLHSGLSAAEHKIHTLSEGHLLQSKTVWDVLSDAGYRVWICGSMNPRSDMPINGYLLPDPWSTGIPPQPQGEFEIYDRYIRSSVQEHTSKAQEIRPGSGAFLWYMLKHGLSLATVFGTLRQLASERLANTKWRRATIMDQFQWDLFRFYARKSQPHFSTFFLNSTAHLQHCYWRNMEPEKFHNRPSDKEQRQLQGAILYGYKKMDRLVKRFIKLASTDTTLVFCSALSQQPYLDHEGAGGRHYFHLVNETVLIEHFGITEPFSYEPLMAEQFYLRFNSEEQAQRAAEKLRAFRVRDKRVFEDDRTQLFHLTQRARAVQAQCRCTRAVPQDVVITADGTSTSLPFYRAFYEFDTLKSGRHHPDGMLWIRWPDRQHSVHKAKISIRSIAPMILKMFNLEVPSSMAAAPENGHERIVKGALAATGKW